MTAGDLDVVIPVRDGEVFIGEAIASVLDRADRLHEVIVVDDGSVDATPEVVGGFGDQVRLLRQQHAGPSAARNRGVEAATADFVAFLDADDQWIAGIPDPRLARLDDPAVDAVWGALVGFAERPDGTWVDTGRVYTAAAIGALIVRRSSWVRAGGLDETMTNSEDFDWFVRAREQGLRLEATADPVTRYRRHAGTLTTAREQHVAAMLGVVRGAIERRRDETS